MEGVPDLEQPNTSDLPNMSDIPSIPDELTHHDRQLVESYKTYLENETDLNPIGIIEYINRAKDILLLDIDLKAYYINYLKMLIPGVIIVLACFVYSVVILTNYPYIYYAYVCSNGDGYTCADVPKYVLIFHAILAPLLMVVAMYEPIVKYNSELHRLKDIVSSYMISSYKLSVVIMIDLHGIAVVTCAGLLLGKSLEGHCYDEYVYTCNKNIKDNNLPYYYFLIVSVVLNAIGLLFGVVIARKHTTTFGGSIIF